MTLRTLERAILAELQEVTKLGRSLKAANIMEWSTGDCEPPRAGEMHVFLPRHRVNVVYTEPIKKGKG